MCCLSFLSSICHELLSNLGTVGTLRCAVPFLLEGWQQRLMVGQGSGHNQSYVAGAVWSSRFRAFSQVILYVHKIAGKDNFGL